MKRSFIEARIEAMLAACQRHGLPLPPFALWREDEYRANPDAARRIATSGLGWNIVEFRPALSAARGSACSPCAWATGANFSKGRGRFYAEKALYAEDGQRAPPHYHVVKTEDIVNRGGARFVIELFKVDRAGAPIKERFRVVKDVTMLDLGPGDRITLEPGESATLEPFVAHSFWAEGGATLAAEVSLVNDDASDNYFVPALPPFAPIEEDRPRRYITVRDHARLLAKAG